MLLDRYLFLAVAKPYAALSLALVLFVPTLRLGHEAVLVLSAMPLVAWFSGSFAFSRLVRDGEISALRASGCTLRRMLVGPIACAAIAATVAFGLATLTAPPATWILRLTQALASILLIAGLLPLSLRYARRDAYLPGGLAVLALAAFETLVSLLWWTASGTWDGTLRVAALDVLALAGMTYALVRAERW
jgi:lipopolysaccharide export LptBFGC system permease protein LptF